MRLAEKGTEAGEKDEGGNGKGRERDAVDSSQENGVQWQSPARSERLRWKARARRFSVCELGTPVHGQPIDMHCEQSRNEQVFSVLPLVRTTLPAESGWMQSSYEIASSRHDRHGVPAALVSLREFSVPLSAEPSPMLPPAAIKRLDQSYRGEFRHRSYEHGFSSREDVRREADLDPIGKPVKDVASSPVSAHARRNQTFPAATECATIFRKLSPENRRKHFSSVTVSVPSIGSKRKRYRKGLDHTPQLRMQTNASHLNDTCDVILNAHTERTQYMPECLEPSDLSAPQSEGSGLATSSRLYAHFMMPVHADGWPPFLPYLPPLVSPIPCSNPASLVPWLVPPNPPREQQ
eukprot:c47576_g1_i1 orf=233-1282(-)